MNTVRQLVNPLPSRVLLAAVIALLAAAAGAGSAIAQGWGNLSDAAAPQLTVRDLQEMERTLALDPAQREVIETIIVDYQEDLRKMGERLRDDMAKLREDVRARGAAGGNWMERIEPFREKMTSMEAEKDRRDERMWSDIKAVLREDQLDRWSEFERFLRRKRLLPRGILAGESVDLIALVDTVAVDATQRAALEPTLDEYAREIDLALQAREDAAEQARENLREMFQERDLDRTAEQARAQNAARLRVRDINHRYMQRLAAELGDAGERFREAYRREAYPDVHQETYAERAVRAALGLPDLTEGARQSIEALAGELEQRLEVKNREIERLYREHEPERLERRIDMVRALVSGERVDREPDPIREALRERREFEGQIVGRLKSLLTPEQIAALPASPSRPDFEALRSRPREVRQRALERLRERLRDDDQGNFPSRRSGDGEDD